MPKKQKPHKEEPALMLELPGCGPDGKIQHDEKKFLYGTWNRRSVKCRLYVPQGDDVNEKYFTLTRAQNAIDTHEALKTLHVPYVERALGVVGVKMPPSNSSTIGIGIVYPRDVLCSAHDPADVMALSKEVAQKCALQCLAAFAAAHQCGVLCTGSVVYVLKDQSEKVHRVRIVDKDGAKQKTFLFKTLHRVSIQNVQRTVHIEEMPNCIEDHYGQTAGAVCFGYKEELIDEYAFTLVLQRAITKAAEEPKQYLTDLLKSISPQPVASVDVDNVLCDLKKAGVRRSGDVLLSDGPLFDSLLESEKVTYCHVDYDSEIRLDNPPFHHAASRDCVLLSRPQ